MAEQSLPKRVTWKDKLDQGLPLNELEETQAVADFNFKKHAREQEEKKAFDALKAGTRPVTQPESLEDKKGK
jgi:hypothetical protein